MVLGNFLTVKDGSTNLKCPPRYFPWGWGGGGGGGWVGGEKLKLMLTQSSCAGAGTELGNIKNLLVSLQPPHRLAPVRPITTPKLHTKQTCPPRQTHQQPRPPQQQTSQSTQGVTRGSNARRRRPRNLFLISCRIFQNKLK